MTVTSSSSPFPVLRLESDLEVRRKALGLAEIMGADHVVYVTFPSDQKKVTSDLWPRVEATLAKGLEGRAFLGPLKWIKSCKGKSEALLFIR